MNREDLEISTNNPHHRGGQHVGLIPRGVTARHLPTGLTASCDCKRSQMQNRDVAIAMIKYGLAEIGNENSTRFS